MSKGTQSGTVYARILEATGTTKQTELAAVLGVRQSSISDALSRGSVPPRWLFILLTRFHAHPEWILSGSGPKFMELVPTNVWPMGCEPESRP